MGIWFYAGRMVPDWLERLPVTQEAAGSSPVAPPESRSPTPEVPALQGSGLDERLDDNAPVESSPRSSSTPKGALNECTITKSLNERTPNKNTSLGGQRSEQRSIGQRPRAQNVNFEGEVNAANRTSLPTSTRSLWRRRPVKLQCCSLPLFEE